MVRVEGVEAIVAQVGDVGVGFRRRLAVGPELKLVMFRVEGACSPRPGFARYPP